MYKIGLSIYCISVSRTRTLKISTKSVEFVFPAKICDNDNGIKAVIYITSDVHIYFWYLFLKM